MNRRIALLLPMLLLFAQETGMAKNKVYHVLNDLVEYGLVRLLNSYLIYLVK